MPELEEIKSVSEHEKILKSEEGTASLDAIKTGVVEEVNENSASPHIELKKHISDTPVREASLVSPSAEKVAELQSPVSKSEEKQQDEGGLVQPVVPLEVDVDIVLGRKRISLESLTSLTEGELISLNGPDFQAQLFVQERILAEGALVMVEQTPTIQITKIFHT